MAKQKTTKKREKKELIDFIVKTTGVQACKIKPFSVKGHPHTYTIAIRTKKDHDAIFRAFPIEDRKHHTKPHVAYVHHNRNAGRYSITLKTVAIPVSDNPIVIVKPYPWEQQESASSLEKNANK